MAPKRHQVGKYGWVSLVDHMPQQNLDRAVADAARVSYAPPKDRTDAKDRGLIRYLMRHWHSTPFEMVEFKFHVRMPIYVARQHMRHRMASINEVSGRYTELPEEFEIPQEINYQSTENNQGSGEALPPEEQCELQDLMAETTLTSWSLYDELLDRGVSKEQARTILPLNTHTQFIWKINLHNLLHYLHLRLDPHAQREIREYAQVICDLVTPLVPWTMEAFWDYRVNAITFTGVDMKYLRGELKRIPNKRERDEFDAKVWVLYKCYKELWRRGVNYLLGYITYRPARP